MSTNSTPSRAAVNAVQQAEPAVNGGGGIYIEMTDEERKDFDLELAGLREARLRLLHRTSTKDREDNATVARMLISAIEDSKDAYNRFV
jgi:hypothetical protein